MLRYQVDGAYISALPFRSKRRTRGKQFLFGQSLLESCDPAGLGGPSAIFALTWFLSSRSHCWPNVGWNLAFQTFARLLAIRDAVGLAGSMLCVHARRVFHRKVKGCHRDSDFWVGFGNCDSGDQEKERLMVATKNPSAAYLSIATSFP
jgi:hypothetical protein